MKEGIISAIILIVVILVLTPAVSPKPSPREEGEKEIYSAVAKNVEASTKAIEQDTRQAARWPIITLISTSGLTILFGGIVIFMSYQQHLAMKNMMYITMSQRRRIEYEVAPWVTKSDMCLFYDKKDQKHIKDTHLVNSQGG